MKIRIELDLSEAEAKRLLENSVERVINNAKHVASLIPSRHRDHDLALQAIADLEELGPIVIRSWLELQNWTFIELAIEEDHDWAHRMRDARDQGRWESPISLDERKS